MFTPIGREQLKGETWPPILPGAQDEVLEFSILHSPDEAKTAGTGEFTVHIPGQAVTNEVLVVEGMFAGGQDGTTYSSETVLIQLEPALDGIGDPFRGGRDAGLRLFFIAVMEEEGAEQGEQQAYEQYQTCISVHPEKRGVIAHVEASLPR